MLNTALLRRMSQKAYHTHYEKMILGRIRKLCGPAAYQYSNQMLPPKTSSIEIIHIATKLECNLGSLIRKVANAPQLTRSGDLETDEKHDGGLHNYRYIQI